MPTAVMPAPVDVARVLDSLSRLGLRSFVDDEGDVGIPWRSVTVHVIFQDTRAFQLRGLWHRIADTEHLAALRQLVEDWNATRIGPKAYLTLSDAGVVIVPLVPSAVPRASARSRASSDLPVAVGPTTATRTLMTLRIRAWSGRWTRGSRGPAYPCRHPGQ